MGRIIHCSDLVLKIGDQEISNVTEWILESTEFRPLQPDTCIVKDEMDKYEKLWVILMIWLFLVFLAIFYCYFCEQRLFPSQKLFDRSLVDTQGLLTDGRCPNQECNHRNMRFSPGPKRLDLSKFRSSCLQGQDRSSSSSSLLLPEIDSSQNCNPGYGAPALGEFRILSENENYQKKYSGSSEYALKKRIM
eukprot:TRINITY_DN10819_c0_g1_i5.p1 TRINITY_DN10819_c0_g1~~TRINITY_DN10819_c0_g1_i5.p1  ORF type:complete len:191 (-),score=62.56 TRINITY_DN10819_c0_g1_i5:53-625(-)